MRSRFRFNGFDGHYRRETSTATWTQAVQLRATPAATRLVVAVLATSGSSAHTHTSCTVLGTALTARLSHASAVLNLSLYADYIAAGQAGDAVSVVSAACSRWGLWLFSFPRASAVPATTYTDNGGALTAALALTAGGIAIIGHANGGSDSRPSWSGMKPIQFQRHNDSLCVSAAIHRSRRTLTKNITVDPDDSVNNPRLVGAVWA